MVSHLSQLHSSTDLSLRKKTAYPPTKTNSEFTPENSCFEGPSPYLSLLGPSPITAATFRCDFLIFVGFSGGSRCIKLLGT